MIRPVLLAGLFLSSAAFSAPATRHATGSFAVSIKVEGETPASAGARSTARMAMTKDFTGGFTGRATGTMLSVGEPNEPFAAYVAIDQVTGTLDGRKGGFVLLHNGSMRGPKDMTMAVAIAPGSGTGGLAGITGTMTITIVGREHRYDLAYTLPAAR